jgi:LCP family protein required for cell wall assembly
MLRYAILLGLCLTAGCNAPFWGANRAVTQELATADPSAPATPTPFLPLPPTDLPPATPTLTPLPSPTPTPTPPWGDFAGPSQPVATQVPPPMPLIVQNESVVNIVLLGSDEDPKRWGSRTDTVMIASLDPRNGTVTLLSIPRDLYIYIPGWTMNRINTVFAAGGFEYLSLTMRYNFGLEVHHWVKVNLAGFEQAIDILGGIYVRVGRSITDKCQDKVYSYTPGTYHMDGRTALCYVRMRKTTSDFDRLRREQEVLQGMFNRVLNLDGLARVPQLYSLFASTFRTDMNLGDVLSLVPLALTLSTDASRIRHFSIGSQYVKSWRVPSSGAAVLLPRREAIEELLQSAFGE